MNFQELLDLLPDCPGAKALPIKADPGGLRYAEQALAEFTGPDLSPSSQIDQPDDPHIMIISAAGAVGKTTLAQEVAYRKQAPIWDLAQGSAVGGNSMIGQLTASFGFDLASQVSGKLSQGELFILVDALDEARVKANEAGFEAFIKNIAEISRTSTGIAFVLLGRTQTAETTWVLLEDAGVPASLSSIQPFTREQAEQYIEAKIQHFEEEEDAARRIAVHRQPFVEARDLILDHLERAVSGDQVINDQTAREFLGYAPVLETVAVLLAKEHNYQDFVADLSGSIGSQSVRKMDRPLAVLEHVVTRLVEREQKVKLKANIRPALEKEAADTGWDAWGSLYSPDEQRMRLLGRILGHELDACPEMPASLQAKYEEQLETWLPEHPFLREGREPANKVFESYLFATAMREYLTPLSRLVETRISANDYKPSRLLADFYIRKGEQLGEEVVAKRQIGLLYDSLLAGETDSLRMRLSIEAGDPDEPDEDDAGCEGEFELVYASSRATEPEQIEVRSFRIVEDEDSISFRRQLKEAEIVTRGTVRLGGDVDDFEIGPCVDIRCGELKIHSTGLVVRSGKPAASASDAVVMEAGECDSTVSRRPTVRGSLSVSWPGAEAYPWSAFAVVPQDEVFDSVQMHDVHRRFRRIVTALRSHSRGSLARFRGKIEHRRVLKNEVGRALLDQLVRDDIMRLDGKFYHWVPDRANALLRVSWDDLRRRRVTPELREYLARFLENNRELF